MITLMSTMGVVLETDSLLAPSFLAANSGVVASVVFFLPKNSPTRLKMLGIAVGISLLNQLRSVVVVVGVVGTVLDGARPL